MADKNCLEQILENVVKVDFIPLDTCKGILYLIPKLTSVAGSGITFGSSALTLAMDGTGDGDMDASPSLSTTDKDAVYGRIHQHTLQCVVTEGFDAVRKKVDHIENIDLVPLFTMRDGGQKVLFPLPNTCVLTVAESFGDLSHTMNVELVMSSYSRIISVE